MGVSNLYERSTGHGLESFPGTAVGTTYSTNGHRSSGACSNIVTEEKSTLETFASVFVGLKLLSQGTESEKVI